MRQAMGRILWLLIFALGASSAAYARDAAFLSAGSAGASSAAADEAVRVDPKADIDSGETSLNIAKRTALFFVNQTNMPVKIEKIVVNSDSNVAADISSNDCEKQGSIAPQSRCSVEISVTPASPGTWNVDVLMTHNGSGRISRAHIIGKTGGATSNDNKSTGLSISSNKDAKPMDFGNVDMSDGKVVRSTLLVNDSPEPITIYSVDVIEADNGLQRLEQGCAVNMELAPESSCPVTLIWKPRFEGTISTDLIIRHSGKLGFAVIPVRGTAKGGGGVKSGDGEKHGAVAAPPSASDLENAMASKLPPISSSTLGHAVSSESSNIKLQLIGTVGQRAVLLRPDGKTVVVPVGDVFEVEGVSVKLAAVSGHSAKVLIDGKSKTLSLEAADTLIAAATAQAREQEDKSTSSSSSEGDGSSSAKKGKR